MSTGYQTKKILIADDEASVARTLARLLHQEGYDVTTVADGEQAVSAVQKEHYGLVILDIKMPRMDGQTAYEHIKLLCPNLPVILMTAYGNIDIAVSAMKRGAFDYIPKPFNVDEMLLMVRKAFMMHSMATTVSRLSQEVDQLRREVRKCLFMDQIVGRSHPMQELFKQVAMIAQSSATVLIRGESGVGKEQIAKAIHQHSPRRKGPLVRINCGAIPETLLESELFGHEKGAFTGAMTTKPGKFELADKGTLFLDEIGEISPLMQVKLLRALQERVIERVGGLRPIPVNVRIIAATNADLEDALGRGKFREDLYYRLKVIEIRVPPLRDRPDDISLLAEYFLMKYMEEMGKSLMFAEETRQALLEYAWPGNVRELQNVVERAVVLATGGYLLPEHLSFWRNEPVTPVRSLQSLALPEEILLGQPLKDLTSSVERLALVAALEKTGGNKAQAARLLGISRRSLQYKLDDYRLMQYKDL